MKRLIHLLSGLEVGGKERVVLDLATRARRRGLDHRLVLFDTPFRNTELDFDPGDVPVDFIERKPGLDWQLPRRVARLLEQHGTEVLHAHNDTAVFYGALAARAARPVRPGHSGPGPGPGPSGRPRFVGTFHTRPGHDTRAARFLTRMAANRAHAITMVSPELGEILERDGWVTRWQTLWNGIDLEHYGPNGSDGGWRERLEVPEGAILVGHVGRFDPVKRQRDLIAAARSLADSTPRIVFALVGQGPEHDAVRAETGALACVRFVPRVRDMVEFLRALDIFVLCSGHEAAPRALLEAMATRRAIVATAVGGIPEMLTPPAEAGSAEREDGSSAGRLVPAREPRELAAAIAELAGNATERDRLGAAARSRAAHFSAEREWAAYAALYGQSPP